MPWLQICAAFLTTVTLWELFLISIILMWKLFTTCLETEKYLSASWMFLEGVGEVEINRLHRALIFCHINLEWKKALCLMKLASGSKWTRNYYMLLSLNRSSWHIPCYKIFLLRLFSHVHILSKNIRSVSLEIMLCLSSGIATASYFHGICKSNRF